MGRTSRYSAQTRIYLGVNGGAIENLVRGTDGDMWSLCLWAASDGEERLPHCTT